MMNKHLEELANTVKAMDVDERKVVLSSIPIDEILEHLHSSYAKMKDKVSRLEAIVNEE